MKKTAIAACAILCILHGGTAQAGTDRTFVLAESHLPKTIVPLRYDIRLDPNLVERSFQGSEKIRLQFTEPSATVAFYALNLRIASLSIDGSKPVSAKLFDSVRGLWRYHFDRSFAAGLHTLSIEYSGKLQDVDQTGLFLADSRDGESLASQMEPLDARRVFPGWDEPIFKARFKLSVVVPKAFTAISNMPVASVRSIAPYQKLVQFETTPRMSTYLVALCAGRYAHASVMAGRTKVTIYTMPSKLWAAKEALQTAAQVIPYYERYFGIPYMLPKLDMVAVPGFNTAMENWGAIVGGENEMLLNARRPAAGQDRHIFEIVTHEIAHQWTGDLVTHANWNDLWLTEGFATWLQDRAEREFHPGWENDPAKAFDRTFELSQDKGNEAIRETGPKRWYVSFSGSQYGKAENLIALIEKVVHPSAFRLAMHRYLVRYAYRNASTNDFLRVMNDASPRNLDFITQPWLYQRGYAHLSVHATCEGNRANVAIDQDPKKWWPVLLADGTIVDRSSYSMQRPCDRPVEAAGLNSYFAVRYDLSALDFIARTFSRTPPALRDIVIEDGWAKAYVSARYLPIVAMLTRADAPRTIQDGYSIADQIEIAAGSTPDAARMQAYVRERLARLGDSLLLSAGTDSSLRRALLYTLSLADDPVAIAMARAQADPKAALDGGFGFADAVSYAIGVHADRAAHAQFLQKARSEPDAATANFWYAAYFSDNDPALIPQELTDLDQFSTSVAYSRAHFLWTLSALDPAEGWNYARAHLSGENATMTDPKDLVETFAAVEDDRSLERGLSHWFTPVELRDVSNWADEARREQARQRRDIHAFVLAHPR